MRLNNEHAQRLLTVLTHLKRISRPGVELVDIEHAFNTLNYINSLPCDDEMVNGRYTLSSYTIPVAFKQLIQPRRVRIADETLALDFRNRAEYAMPSDFVAMDPTTFNDFWDSVVGCVKANDTEFKAITEYRTDQTLADLKHSLKTSSQEDLANVDPYIPVIIVSEFYKNRFFVQEAEFMFAEWCRNTIRGLNKSS